VTRRPGARELARGPEPGEAAGFDARRRLAALEQVVAVQDHVLRVAGRALEELDRRLATVERAAPPSPEPPAAPRRCAACGADLGGRRPQARYCSARCRWRARSAHAFGTLPGTPPTDRAG